MFVKLFFRCLAPIFMNIGSCDDMFEKCLLIICYVNLWNVCFHQKIPFICQRRDCLSFRKFLEIKVKLVDIYKVRMLHMKICWIRSIIHFSSVLYFLLVFQHIILHDTGVQGSLVVGIRSIIHFSSVLYFVLVFQHIILHETVVQGSSVVGSKLNWMQKFI